jgi:hypothetical protein
MVSAGCGGSQLTQDRGQPGLVGGGRRRRAGLEAGQVSGRAGLQEVIGVVAVERQRDRADLAAAGGQERQRDMSWEPG